MFLIVLIICYGVLFRFFFNLLIFNDFWFLMEIILGFGLFFIIENIVYIRWWLELFRLIELVILWLVCKLGLIMIRLINDLEFVVIFVGCLIIYEY